MYGIQLKLHLQIVCNWVKSCTTYEQTEVCRQFGLQLLKRELGKLDYEHFKLIRKLSTEVDIRNYEILKDRYPQLLA